MNTESREIAYILMELLGRPTHVAEIGAYNPEHLQMLPFVYDTYCRVDLFEPQPDCVANLNKAFKNKNVSVHACAIGSEHRQTYLQVPEARRGNPHAGASAFLEGVSSPYTARAATMAVEETTVVRVEVRPFSDFDDGTIQGMSIDTEGCEWFVLQHLESRPVVISVEVGGPHGYINQYKTEIEDWMRKNGYSLYSKETVAFVDNEVRTEIDTDHIYVRDERIKELKHYRGQV